MNAFVWYVHEYVFEVLFIVICIVSRGLGDLVAHSAASAKGPGFNSLVARAYMRFNSRASALARK